MKHLKYGWALALVLAGAATTAATAADKPANKIETGTSYQNDISLPLYYLPAWNGPDQDEDGREAAENPKLPINHVDSADPVIQHTFGPSQRMPSPLLNFDGIPFPGVGCNCAPPDPNGAIGKTQYLQMVNEGFQVFDKTTGNSLIGPNAISSVWAGFGGVCETAGNGDPVVLYDQLADRWLISQFAGSSVPTDECIAVSTSGDATDTYYRYAFHLGSNFFDYPHLSVWPDGYYMSMNIFNSSGTLALGPQAFAFDRNAMLAGTTATYVSPGITGGPNENSFLPGNLDGSTLPPNGAPEPFVEFPGTGTYRVFHFHPDFVTPTNTTFTLFDNPAAAGFSTLCGGTRACVPQLGGTGSDAIDGIGDRLMFRLAYRNFGDHESLVGNYSVKANNVAGVRWFELRNVTAGPVSVFQESTFQPDTTWRWMGSAAMDSAGNIAVGYSASDATIHPQLRYAGRLASDPPGTLTQGEAHLFDGAGSQNASGNRWGDYSALTVDPVDDCTFWYTNEYYATTGQFNWRTRIGNFKFDACGTPGFTLSVTPQAASVCVGTPANFTVNLGSVSDFNSPVTLSASANPAPSTVSFAPNPVPTLPGSSSMTVANTTGVAAGSYTIQVSGTAAGAPTKSAPANLSVFAVVPPAATLTTPANNATNQPVRPTFSWSGSNTETYTIDIATDAAFGNIVFTQAVTGTSATPDVDLASNTQYYWRISTANACGAGAVSPTFTFTTLPLPGDCSTGSNAQTVYSYGYESGLNGWTLGAGSVGNTWADNTTTVHSGAHSWHATDPGAVSDQRFVSPSIALPSGQAPLTLQFWNKRDMEPNGDTACFDGGILEASTNAGSTWTQVGAAMLLTDPYTGAIDTEYNNPLAGLQAWCGVQDWTNSIVDVSAYAGQSVQFRFRLGSDESVAHDGWYLDDVKVQSCLVGSGQLHTVTPSAGQNGAIAPSTPQQVSDGAAINFTLTPNAGYSIGTVTGTCGGSLAGNVFTTSPVTADCTVVAAFNAPAAVAVVSGGSQTTPVDAAFPNALIVKVTDAASSPVSGVVVHFAAQPAGSGASATLSAATATTDATGQASVTATANAIAGNYTVQATVDGVTNPASFALTNTAQSGLAVTIDDGQDYAGYGQTLHYTVTVSNAGPSAASDIAISQVFPAELDLSQATWVCNGGTGVQCAASGSGALTDSGIVIPAGGSATWTLTAPVKQDTTDPAIDNTVSITSASDTTPANDTATDHDVLVIFRSGFELGETGKVAPK